MSSDQFPIQTAIKDHNINLAKQLISEKPKSTILKDDDERTPLHWAVSINNSDLVQFIVENLSKGTDIDELVDASGWTPIHINASIGNVEILNILMHTDPQPDINLATNQGTTALHLSISKTTCPMSVYLLMSLVHLVVLKIRRGIRHYIELLQLDQLP